MKDPNRNIDTVEDAEALMGGEVNISEAMKKAGEAVGESHATQEIADINSQLAANRQSHHISSGAADIMMVQLEGLYRSRDSLEAMQGCIADQIADASSGIRKLEATISALRAN